VTFLRQLVVFLAINGLIGAAAAETGPSGRQDAASCGGVFKQGGLVICTGEPGTQFSFDGRDQVAPDSGIVTFGVAREAPAKVTIAIGPAGRESWSEDFSIAPRDDPFRVIEGLDCDKVDARTPEQKAHAARSWRKKQAAFSDFAAHGEAVPRFHLPAEGRTSSPFGPARKYVGTSETSGESCEKVSVHRGFDIAAPIGTPITAPAAGTVILADPDLYYEGGTVFLDHGHGLVSVMMHMSEVDLEAGQVVEAGERLGAVGNTGRTTGPHLHWALKWRGAEHGDRGEDFYIDPALALELDPTGPGVVPGRATSDVRE